MLKIDSIPSNIVALMADAPYTLDDTGMSGAAILISENWVLKIEAVAATEKAHRSTLESCRKTVETMRWLQGRLPVPKVLAYEEADGKCYLLMSKMQGKMSCDEYYLERPRELVSLLVQALHKLWQADITDCSLERTYDVWLEEARRQVELKLVDVDNVEPETFGEGGFANPEELLAWLEDNRPSYEPVLSHGDFCLPNVFLAGDKVTGFIDLSDVSVSDKWRDIALCYRSLKHNFDGTYGGKVYEDFRPEILFEELGIEPDWEKLKWHILLDELF